MSSRTAKLLCIILPILGDGKSIAERQHLDAMRRFAQDRYGDLSHDEKLTVSYLHAGVQSEFMDPFRRNQEFGSVISKLF